MKVGRSIGLTGELTLIPVAVALPWAVFFRAFGPFGSSLDSSPNGAREKPEWQVFEWLRKIFARFGRFARLALTLFRRSAQGAACERRSLQRPDGPRPGSALPSSEFGLRSSRFRVPRSGLRCGFAAPHSREACCACRRDEFGAAVRPPGFATARGSIEGIERIEGKFPLGFSLRQYPSARKWLEINDRIFPFQRRSPQAGTPKP